MLEIHELVAFQSIGLVKIKKSIGDVKDVKLRELYTQVMNDLDNNLTDLTRFYSLAAREGDEGEERDIKVGKGFMAGDLLVLCKTAIRNYAIAITETATPAVRDTLNKHLQKAITNHGKIFDYMYDSGMYPAYDMNKLLGHDIQLANQAKRMEPS